MVYGLIIAAGKQSRFDCDTPKALMLYGESTLLDMNIENMKSTCDEVFVVTSTENTSWFTGNYKKLVIDSGRGCGDAVMRALNLLDFNEDDTVFIQWGDCLHTKHIYQDLRKEYDKHNKWLIPCVKEDSPYVQIIPCEDSKIHVIFSKYDESVTPGYHDLSLFYGNAMELQKQLIEFAKQIQSTENSNCYKHKHGNEMQFLDVFNETELCGVIIEFNSYDIFAFNTLDEFNTLLTTS